MAEDEALWLMHWPTLALRPAQRPGAARAAVAGQAGGGVAAEADRARVLARPARDGGLLQDHLARGCGVRLQSADSTGCMYPPMSRVATRCLPTPGAVTMRKGAQCLLCWGQAARWCARPQ